MRRNGIVPAAAAPEVDPPLVDVEAFSQVPLEERWQLMAGALNRLARVEVLLGASIDERWAGLERRIQRLEAALDLARADATRGAHSPLPEATPAGYATPED